MDRAGFRVRVARGVSGLYVAGLPGLPRAAGNSPGETNPLHRTGWIADELDGCMLFRSGRDDRAVGSVERDRHVRLWTPGARLHLHDELSLIGSHHDRVHRPLVG